MSSRSPRALDRAFTSLGAAVARHRVATVLLWIVVATAAGMLLPRFRIDPDVGALLPKDDPQVAALLAADTLDPSSRDLLIVVRDRTLVDDRAAFDEAIERVRALDTVEAVAVHGSEFGPDEPPAPLWSLERADLEALETRLSDDGRAAAIAEAKALLRSDPFLGRDLVERDPLGLRWALDPARASALGRRLDPSDDRVVLAASGAALVRVRAKRSPFDQAATVALVDGVHAAFDTDALDLVGGHAVAREDARRIRADMVRSSATSAPLVLLFLAVSLGSFALAHVVLVPVLLATLAALGFGGALLGPLPALGVASAAILVGLGVDFGLHIVSRIGAEARHGVTDDVELDARAVGGTGTAVLGGAATSIAAFLAFAATAVDGLARFGWLLSIGLIAALLAALTIVPALAAPVVRRRLARGTAPPADRRWLGRRSRVLVAVLVTVAALGLGSLAAVRGITFDAGPRFLRPQSAEAPLAAARLGADLGFAPAGLVVLAPERDDAERDDAEGGDAERLRRAGAELLASGVAGATTGAALAAPDPDRAARVASFRTRTDGWVAAALEDLARAGFRAERLRPALEETAAALARDPVLPANARVSHAGTAWIRAGVHPAVAPEGRAQREALRAAVTAAFPEGSLVVDPYGLGDALGPVLSRSLARTVEWSLGAIALLVLLLVRRPLPALVALLPSAAALAITLGALVLLGWPIHPGNLVTLPLVLGLGVDDGLHLVLRYAERDGAGDPLATTGRAIWRTTVTTILGFGSLAFAVTPALQSLGVLVAIGTASAFLATVTIVPAFAGRLER